MTTINGIEQTPQQIITRLKKELKELKHTLKNCDYLNGGAMAHQEIPHVAKELKYNQNILKIENLTAKQDITRNSNSYDKLTDKIDKLRKENSA